MDILMFIEMKYMIIYSTMAPMINHRSHRDGKMSILLLQLYSIPGY